MSSQRLEGAGVSRRKLLGGVIGLTGAAAAGSLLAACGGGAPPTSTPAPQKPAAAATPAAEKPAAAATQAPAATAAPAAKPTEAPKPAAAPKPSGAQVTIKFHARQGQQEDELYKQRIPEFEAKYPNIKAVLENFPTNEYYAKIATMAAGGTIGDAAWTSIGSGSIYFLYARKIIYPVDDFVSRDKFDLTPYFPGCIKALTRDGKLIGLPFKAHPGIALVYYNKKLFDDAGVKYPTEEWKHADLVDLAKKLTKAPDYYGFLPTTTARGLLSFVKSFGGELLSEDGKTSQLNSKEGLGAIQFVDALFHEHKVSPAPDQIVGDSNQMWIAGKLAMFHSGTSTEVTRKQIGDKFQFFAVPNAKGPGGIGGSNYEVDAYAVIGSSKHKDEAWELVKWLTDQESGIRLGEIGGTVGGREDVYNSPRLLKDPIRKVFADVMAKAGEFRIPANTRTDEYEKTTQQMLDPVWLGKEKPTKEYVDKVRDAVQKVLDKPLP